MKMKKIMAAVLAVSVMASVAGCAKVKKITLDDFVAACEKMGAEEIDPDESGVDSDDYADGIYTIMDHDYIEDHADDFTMSSELSMLGSSAPDVDSIIDADDIDQMALFVKLDENTDDVSDPEDFSDLDINGVAAVHITLTEADMAEEIMGNIADLLDDLDIDVEELDSNEYYVGKNEGYLKFNISAEDLAASFAESETAGYLEMLDVDVEEITEGITGSISVATYINGENMVVIIGGAVNNDPEYLDEFCGNLGIPTPSSLSSNTMIAEAICDYVDDTIGSMLSSFAAMSSYDF